MVNSHCYHHSRLSKIDQSVYEEFVYKIRKTNKSSISTSVIIPFERVGRIIYAILLEHAEFFFMAPARYSVEGNVKQYAIHFQRSCTKIEEIQYRRWLLQRLKLIHQQSRARKLTDFDLVLNLYHWRMEK